MIEDENKKLTASIPLYLDSTVQPSGERRWAIRYPFEMPVPPSAYRGSQLKQPDSATTRG
jgi:hypothetical protein